MGPSNYVMFTSDNAVERRYYEKIYLFSLSFEHRKTTMESNLAQFFVVTVSFSIYIINNISIDVQYW